MNGADDYLPQLTDAERDAMDDATVEKILTKVFGRIAPAKPKPWFVVAIRTGCRVKRYETQEQARASAAVRNARARIYRISEAYTWGRDG